MTQGVVLDIMRNAIYNVIINSAPMLFISLIVGLVVSVFQTVTSIQEQTLTFVPKLLSIFVALIVFGSFIMTNLTTYMTDLWTNFSVYIK
ncbi:MAG: flagellar biosynthesis protein FliQ [Lachnospiraceae bacterium]|jgi:flagellar biosynthetic protein FliQ|nr:flagellar biosynthesis protein FliQ [Lachnospiraceae bacterium]MCI7329148.1 flagellar biosynthesis protein FliQ [Lachnospiraceae bacterium]MDD7702241.1 flagellar biosynthesis protein FliQ [Lachnospiraceae bacterium]MDY3301398.1 flagellar biosynthesis protein FliQ [Lachnospiraceae bacterium]MEE3379146.1 flagellar biosynthesis protein FliQ [Lachnospiraceae bacterium]